ncbi:MAG TPA: phosphoribosylanthranilate isomerase [Caulobacteraceae bacterium]|nr:phosphoribosylanthranilate isomerase [Caulobacteraceae bacterium]
MTKAKICGLKTPEAVRAALDGGAVYLGFNFFAASPRAVGPEAAARLAEPVRGRAKIAAVTVDADDDSLDLIVRTLRPDLVQLHGRETPARARAIAARTGAGVIKVFPVQVAADVDAAAAFDGLVEHLMFDTKPGADDERPGGLGRAFDWTLLAGRRFQRPHFLAGGLDPWNVAEAIALSGAPLVDVSSGVERGAGLKDAGLISAFLDAVARA